VYCKFISSSCGYDLVVEFRYGAIMGTGTANPVVIDESGAITYSNSQKFIWVESHDKLIRLIVMRAFLPQPLERYRLPGSKQNWIDSGQHYLNTPLTCGQHWRTPQWHKQPTICPVNRSASPVANCCHPFWRCSSGVVAFLSKSIGPGRPGYPNIRFVPGCRNEPLPEA